MAVLPASSIPATLQAHGVRSGPLTGAGIVARARAPQALPSPALINGRSFITPRRLERELGELEDGSAGRPTPLAGAAGAPVAQAALRAGGRHVSTPRAGAVAPQPPSLPPRHGDVGIKVRTHQGRQLVSAMLPGGPAELSEVVMLHDVIESIDAKAASGLSAHGKSNPCKMMKMRECNPVGFADRGVLPATDVHRLLHGPLGSTVSLTLARAGSAKHVVKLTRASVLSQSALSPRGDTIKSADEKERRTDDKEDGYSQTCPHASSPATTPRPISTKTWAAPAGSYRYAPIPSLSPPQTSSSQTDDEADDGRAYQAWKAGTLRAQAAQARVLKRQVASSCATPLSEARPPRPSAGSANADAARLPHKRKDSIANLDAASLAAMIGCVRALPEDRVGLSAHAYSQRPAPEYGTQPVVPPLMLHQLPASPVAHDDAGKCAKAVSAADGPVCTAREALAGHTRVAALGALNTEVGALADAGRKDDERSERLWSADASGHLSPEPAEARADRSMQQEAAAVVEHVERQWTGCMLLLVCAWSLTLPTAVLSSCCCRRTHEIYIQGRVVDFGCAAWIHSSRVRQVAQRIDIITTKPEPATAQNSREGMTQSRPREGGRRRQGKHPRSGSVWKRRGT
jgi:hypothetical protein